MAENSTTAKPRFSFFLRMALGFGLFIFILLSVDLNSLADSFRSANPTWVIGAFFLSLCSFFVSARRWQNLLEGQDVKVSLWRLFTFYLEAHFFLFVLPGFFTSDAVRLVSIRDAIKQTALGMSTILVERLTGFIALCSMGVVAAFLTPKLDAYPGVRIATLAMLILTVVALGLMLNPFIFNLITPYLPWKRLQDFVGRFALASDFYRKNPRLLLETFLFSALIQSFTVFGMYFHIQAFGLDVGLLDAIAITPIIILVTVIPISPGALGLQEGVYIVLMRTLGIDASQALAISLLSRGIGLVLGAAGGIHYFFVRR
jgi:glycosyltransferase 2 family protein